VIQSSAEKLMRNPKWNDPPALLTGNPTNRLALEHLRGLSAHSDAAEPLCRAVQDLPGAETWSANPLHYGYVIAYTGDIVFGFVSGMQGLCLRLSDDAMRDAIDEGAQAFEEAGDDWVFIALFDPDRRVPRVRHWIEMAYAHACKQ
jgi:hypothetical protein